MIATHANLGMNHGGPGRVRRRHLRRQASSNPPPDDKVLIFAPTTIFILIPTWEGLIIEIVGN